MIHQQVARLANRLRSSQSSGGHAQQLLSQLGVAGARIEPNGKKSLGELQILHITQHLLPWKPGSSIQATTDHGAAVIVGGSWQVGLIAGCPGNAGAKDPFVQIQKGFMYTKSAYR
ncbi:hypothetical protein AB7M25_002338 [Pseudomonas sp. AP3_22 TE3818]